jgi:hypothetical protein
MTAVELLETLRDALLNSDTTKYNVEIIENKYLRVNGLIFEENAIWNLYLENSFQLDSEILGFQSVLQCIQDEVYLYGNDEA